MSLKLMFGVLLLTKFIICDNDFLIINLADGGTSSPIKLMPENILDSYERTNLDDNIENINEKNMTINLHNKRDLGTEFPLFDMINSTGIIPNTSPLITTESSTILPDHEITTVGMITTTPTTTQHKESTTLSTTPTTNVPTTTSVKSSYIVSSEPSEVTTPTNASKSCHEACRNDIGAIHLYQLQERLTLPVGSNLTLLCELPLTGNFTLENILWLYEAERTPECSLTSQEFISSCTGFQVIYNEDDRNETFLRETLHLTGLTFNNTGNFICQAEVTCCQDTNDQNVIIKQEKLYVKIWHSDYTVDLAIMGSVAAVMILAVAAISFLISRRRRIAYVAIDNENIQVKATTVLHMPLVQYDDDNDSFDSQFDD